jgi:hypothetical protein
MHIDVVLALANQLLLSLVTWSSYALAYLKYWNDFCIIAALCLIMFAAL